MKTDPTFVVAFMNDVLIRERILQGRSVEYLAEETRISKTTLHRKLSGLTPWSIPELAVVCEALEMSLTELVNRAEVLAEEALETRYEPVPVEVIYR